MRRAVFLDRDGVLVEDVDFVTHPRGLRLLPGAPAALARLKDAGFWLVIVTNQAVVARGLASEADVDQVNAGLARLITRSGGPALDGIYSCPHHPNASVPAYRIDCACRKPKPGMLLRAAEEHGLDLSASFMVGDRITDVIAGKRAGCRTALVRTGRHLDPPIETLEGPDTAVEPDRTCADLAAAAEWILHAA